MAPAPKILESRTLRDRWPPITEDEVELADGKRKSWVRFHFGTSAAVLPVTTTGEVVLTREYRHGLGRVDLALPGGTAEDGESAETCARRELLEETGLAAGKLLHLYSGNSLTGYLTGTLHLFLAKDCKPTGRPLDPDEVEALVHLKPHLVLDQARRGEFESTVLTLAVLLADARGWLIA